MTQNNLHNLNKLINEIRRQQMKQIMSTPMNNKSLFSFHFWKLFVTKLELFNLNYGTS